MSYNWKKNERQEYSVTSDEKDPVVKPLRTAVDQFDSRFLRPRSSTHEDVGSMVLKDNELGLSTKQCPRIPSLDVNESQRGSNQRTIITSSLVQQVGSRFADKRLSLPNSLSCSLVNSPRFQRRRSDYHADWQKSGLSAKDMRKLSEGLSKLEKAKPRSKPYEEEPFYLCPENGSFRRNYWTSESLALEKRILESKRKTVTLHVEEKDNKRERSLSEILPPVVLSSIYAQESNKAKRMEADKEARKKTKLGKKSRSNELSADVSLLTKDLSDCRYLRIPKNSV